MVTAATSSTGPLNHSYCAVFQRGRKYILLGQNWFRVGFYGRSRGKESLHLSLSLSLSLHPEWPCFPKRIVYGQNPISQSCQNTAICQQGLKRVRTEKSIWSVLFTVHGCMSLVLPPVSSLSLVRRSFIREKAKHLIPFYSCLFSGGR